MECVISPSSSVFIPVFYEIDVSLSINAFELSANCDVVAGITYNICLQKTYGVQSYYVKIFYLEIIAERTIPKILWRPLVIITQRQFMIERTHLFALFRFLISQYKYVRHMIQLNYAARCSNSQS